MAIMIPDTIREVTKKAERRLFNRFRSELPDDSYVLHSLGLVNHEKKLWGECDYVILSRLGVFILEVKGGRVSCQDGIWHFTGIDNISNTKPEGPFEQAKSAMFAVRDVIQENSDLKGFMIGYGVIMPDETFLETGPEIEQGVLLDRRNINNIRLDTYIIKLKNFWADQYTNKHNGRAMLNLEKADIEKIRRILRPDIRTALTLGSSLCRIEQEQVELIEQQMRILQRMDVNPRTLISGGAGTGKTLLALDTAVRRAKQGQRTLYLCYNKLLGRHVREHVEATFPSPLLTASNIHDFFKSIIEEANLMNMLSQHSTEPEYFSQIYPDIYQEALIQLNYESFDCLILDEGQDLLSHPFLDALDLTLKSGLSAGIWHIFLDRLQTIHNGFDSTVLERLKGYGYAEFPLTVNCRNTRTVAISASIVSGIDISLEEVSDGGIAEIKFISRDGNQYKVLDKLIDKLVKEGVNRDDIVILTKHPFKNSTLAEIRKIGGFRICDLTEDSPMRGIDFCTIHSFKGLERKIVIAWDLDDLDHELNRLLHYCGLSRARSCLFVFINESQRTAYERLATEFGIRQAELAKVDYGM